MREEIEQHPREPERDIERRRMTERGTDPGTSEPGTPSRILEEGDGRDRESSERPNDGTERQTP